MTVESHVVQCRQCHRTRVVAVSDQRPPCFRNIEELADCPEVLQRRSSGDEALLTMMCGALAGSFAENLQSAAVEVVDREGNWQVVCRIPGDVDRYYSSEQALSQSEIWGRHGRTGLARRLRESAKDAHQASRSRQRLRRLVPMLALGIVVAAVGVARHVPTWSTRPTDVAIEAVAEQQSVAVRTPAPPAERLMAAEPAGPQLAVLKTTAPASPEPAASEPAASEAVTSEVVTSPDAVPSSEAVPLALQASSTEQVPANPSAKVVAAAASAAINAASTPQAARSPEPVLEPEMVSLPGDTFAMGSNLDPSEAPIHTVSIKPFAISKSVVTVREWSRCVVAKACAYVATDEDDDAPVTNVSFDDAQQFIAWLTQETGTNFRLPTEAEWEYAARGGTRTKYWWGDDVRPGIINCKKCNGDQNARQTAKVEDFKPNPFGLYDMGGNVAQWVSDCWHKNYQGAVADGSAWVDPGSCILHVVRSGSWRNAPNDVRPASRDYYDGRIRYPMHGFRVARSL